MKKPPVEGGRERGDVMDCKNCMLVDALKTKIEAQQYEINVMNQEADGIMAILNLIFAAVDAKLKENNSTAQTEEATEKNSDTLKQIGVLANSISKVGEDTTRDRLAAFLDTVKGLSKKPPDDGRQ